MDKYKLDKLPKYLHISFNDNIKLENIKQGNTFKPRGLYYARNIEWLKFMKNGLDYKNIHFTKKYLHIVKNKYYKNYKKEKYKIPNMYLYKIIIPGNIKISIYDKPDINKILVLKSYKQVDIFTDKYKYKSKTKYININWKKLSKDYAGIEFTNYEKINNKIIKEIRFDIKIKHKLVWFTAFDVNGGCIWNIKSIRIKKLHSLHK